MYSMHFLCWIYSVHDIIIIIIVNQYSLNCYSYNNTDWFNINRTTYIVYINTEVTKARAWTATSYSIAHWSDENHEYFTPLLKITHCIYIIVFFGILEEGFLAESSMQAMHPIDSGLVHIA